MKPTNIEPANYVGYYWMSDATAPVMLQGEPFPLSLDPASNPFIIEAQLFDPEHFVSYSLKYADGAYHIHRFDLNQDFAGDDFEFTSKEYQSHPRLGAQPLLFRQYWKAEEDPLCLGMKVLQPHALVFVGFKEKKEAQS